MRGVAPLRRVLGVIFDMNYVLFIGHRYGEQLLALMLRQGLRVAYAFIEKDAADERVRYFDALCARCEQNGVPYSADLSAANQCAVLSDISPDVILVYGFRRIIREEAFRLAKHGALAMHYALLPRYRGFAPVNWAMINGETETGVSLFYLNSGEVDSGDLVAQARVPIGPDEDIGQVLQKCDACAMDIFSAQLPLFERGIFAATPQEERLATYTCARTAEDGQIQWTQSTRQIYDLIRATTDPFPCAFTRVGGAAGQANTLLRVLDAEIYPVGNYVGRIPGRVIKILPNTGIVVLTADGALLIKRVRTESGEVTTADTLCKSVRMRCE